MDDHVHAITTVTLSENPTFTWREAKASAHYDLVERLLINIQFLPEISLSNEVLELCHLELSAVPAWFAERLDHDLSVLRQSFKAWHCLFRVEETFVAPHNRSPPSRIGSSCKIFNDTLYLLFVLFPRRLIVVIAEPRQINFNVHAR